MSIITYNVSSLDKSNIYVDDDADPSWYDATHVKTIQEGVNNASSGDTILVYNGIYNENIDVNKIVSIYSIYGPSNCTIYPYDVNDHVIEIEANNVNISGLKINGSLTPGKQGIIINTVKYCNVSKMLSSSCVKTKQYNLLHFGYSCCNN